MVMLAGVSENEKRHYFLNALLSGLPQSWQTFFFFRCVFFLSCRASGSLQPVQMTEMNRKNPGTSFLYFQTHSGAIFWLCIRFSSCSCRLYPQPFGIFCLQCRKSWRLPRCESSLPEKRKTITLLGACLVETDSYYFFQVTPYLDAFAETGTR